MKQTDFVVTLFEGKENPNNLTVAVVMGVNALKQGHSASIILMVEAVALGQPGAVQGVDIGAPFPEAGGQVEEFLKLADRYASAMPVWNIMDSKPNRWTRDMC